MELEASLSWLALALTPGLACRWSARLLRKFGSPDRIFHASLTELESCSLPARVAQSIVKQEAFKRAEKELATVRGIPGCRLLNWTEPEYPQDLLQIYDPPVLLYLRGRSAGTQSSLSQHCRHARGRRFTEPRGRSAWDAIWRRAVW